MYVFIMQSDVCARKETMEIRLSVAKKKKKSIQPASVSVFGESAMKGLISVGHK